MNRWLLHFVALAGCGLFAEYTAWTAPPQLPRLERIDVPVDRPDLWPQFANDLIAVSRSDFERRWNALRPKPATVPDVVIEALHLEATLVGSTLTAGSGTLRLQSTSKTPAWLALNGLNLAVSAIEPLGSVNEVLWGAAEDGQLWLQTEPRVSDYACAWSLSGRSLADRLLFDVQLPGVMTATLRLRLPLSHRLSSSQVVVRKLSVAEDPSDAGWAVWEVLAGSERAFQLVVDQTTPSAAVPLVLYRRQLLAAIREDHLRFEASFTPEVLGGDVGELQFTIPKSADLYSVTWGRDTPLVWLRQSLDGPRNLVRVKLPDRQQGVLRSIRLEGIVTQRPGAVATLPEVDLQGGVFRSGTLQLSVTRPLQIVSLRTLGCRQESPVLVTGEGETFQFQQTMPTSRITLQVQHPRSSLSAQVLSSIRCETDEWEWNSEILWTSAAGSEFQLGVRIPAGWEVTDVRGGSGSTFEQIGWEASADADGSSRVAIELLEALTPERPRRLRLQARRQPPTSWVQIGCPLLVPLECQSVTRLTRLSTGPRYEFFADPASVDDVVSPADVAATWRDFPGWAQFAEKRDPSEAELWFLNSDSAPAPWFTRYERALRVRGKVELDVEVGGALLTETYRISVFPEPNQKVNRLLVALSEAGEDIVWQVEHPADQQVIGTRLPVAHQPGTEISATKELWELRLSDVKAEQIVLSGSRVRPMALPARIGLATLPQATSFEARLNLLTNDPSLFQPVTRGLDETPPDPMRGTVRRREWTYSSLQGEFSLISRRTSLLEAPCLGEMTVRSQIAAFEDDYDDHELTVKLTAYPRAIRLRFRTEVDPLYARLDDAELAVGADGVLVIPPGTGSGKRSLLLSYRSRVTRGFLTERRLVPLPDGEDVVWTSCQWDFSLPPTAGLIAEPAGMRLLTPLPQPSWSDRLFGPMSRTADHRTGGRNSALFIPWQLESWRQLGASVAPEPRPALQTDWNRLTIPVQWEQYSALAPAPVADLEVCTAHRGRLGLASWLSLTLSLILVLTVRRFQVAQRNMLAAIWLASWLGVAFAVAPPWVALAGGVLSGSLLGWLTPRPWLEWPWTPNRRVPEVPAGSTQSFTLPKAVTTTVVLLACCASALSNSLAWQEPFNPNRVLLVPVDATGQPTALVYLSAENWQTLLEATIKPEPAPPTALIQLAEYQGTLGVGQRVSVSAKFEVLMLGQQTQLNLPIPVSSFGPAAAQACTVDGQPATITVLPDRTGFQVSWNRTPPGVSAIQATTATRHTIQLDWQHAWRRESGMAVFESLLPYAAISRWRLSGLPFLDSNAREMIDPAFPRAVRVDGAVSQVLGVTDRFRVRWREAGPVAEPIEVQAEVREAILLQPNLAEVRSRTEFRPRTGVSRRMTLSLPPNSVVRKWTSSAAAELVPAGGANSPALWLLEFAEPLVAPASLELEYFTPLPGTVGELRWQGQQWRGGPGVQLTTGAQLWAIYTADELQIQPQTPESSRLLPLALEASRDLFDDLAADRVPRMAYQVSGTDPVIFQTTLNTSRRRQLLWQQTGTIVGDRLRWEIEGDIEVEGPPVYTHVLTVDRRLNIESISVKERGTERLVRWSETRAATGQSAGRITLFLSDAPSQVQRLTMTASIPINPAAAIPLPNVRCEDTQFSGGRIVLKTAPDAELVWAGSRGLRELTNEAPLGSSLATNFQTRVFDQIDPDWRATVRMLSPQEAQAARVVHLISSDDPQTLECRSFWRLPAGRMPDAATLIVPSPWELQSESTVRSGQMDVVRALDGTWNLTIQSEGRGTDVLVDLKLRLQRSGLRSPTVPLPQLVGDLASDSVGWLAEMTRLPQTQLLADETPALDKAPPPDWGSGAWNEMALADNERLRWWRLAYDRNVAVVASPTTEIPAAQIDWLEHRLWCDPQGLVRGVTQVRLSQPVSILIAEFPDPLHFQAAVMSGEPGVTRSESAERVQMSRQNGQPFSEVWLYWEEAGEGSIAPVLQTEFAIPSFPRANVRQVAATLFPAPGMVLRGTGVWSTGDWIDRSLLRLETLGDQLVLYEQHPPLDMVAEYLRDYRLTADQLGTAIDELGHTDGQQVARWKGVVERIDQLPPALREEAVTVPMNGASIEQRLAHQPGIAYGMLPVDAERIFAWRVDRTWVRWVFALVITLVSWPLLAWSIRPGLGIWMQQHPTLATGLLGGVWWLCLAPSIVGCAIVMSAAYRWATTPRPLLVTETGTSSILQPSE